jgi:hypothetical protein
MASEYDRALAAAVQAQRAQFYWISGREGDSLSPEEHRILEAGLSVVHPMMNSVPQCWAWWVGRLAMRGLLRRSAANEYVPTIEGRKAYLSYGWPLVPTTDAPLP